MGKKGLRTIIDVLENALGGDLSANHAAMLTASDLVRLAEAVNEFYDAWQPPVLAEDDLRLYAGGWVAGNLEAPENLQQFYTTLLYAPSVVMMHDPVAEWFEPSRDGVASPPPIRARNGMEVPGAEPQLLRGDGYFAFRDDLDRSHQRLRQVIPMLADLAPLITRGIVVPVPRWRLVREHQESILSAVRHDSRDAELADLIRKADIPPVRADRIRGMEVTPNGGVIASDELRSVVQNPAYYLDKTLAIADTTVSRYTPPAAIDARLFEHRINKLGVELRRKDIDLQVVAALAAADLPFLGALDPKTIVKVRADDPAFADWRAELRTIARTIEESRLEGARFEQEARAVISDSLLPKAREIEKATSRSSVMRAAAKDQGVTLGIGTASTVGAALLLGTPIAPAALAGIGISAVSRWTYTSLFGQSPKGTHGVLTTLVRRR